MTSPQLLGDLERRVAETAELLKGALARLERGESKLREQVPGQMGLGSSQERYASQGGRRR
jgi:hypothetical protein